MRANYKPNECRKDQSKGMRANAKKESRAGHAVATRRVEDKVGSSEARQGSGVIICKASHMNENMQNEGKTVIVVVGERHRWHPWNGVVGNHTQTR